MSVSVENLEARVSDLELQLFGNTIPNFKITDESLESRIKNINQELDSAGSERKFVAKALRNSSNLASKLMPETSTNSLSFTDDLRVRDKARLVILESEAISKITANLEVVKKLQNVLDSDALKNVDEISSLRDLVHVQMEQAEEVDKQRQEMNKLTDLYNSLLDKMSIQMASMQELNRKLQLQDQTQEIE